MSNEKAWDLSGQLDPPRVIPQEEIQAMINRAIEQRVLPFVATLCRDLAKVHRSIGKEMEHWRQVEACADSAVGLEVLAAQVDAQIRHRD